MDNWKSTWLISRGWPSFLHWIIARDWGVTFWFFFEKDYKWGKTSKFLKRRGGKTKLVSCLSSTWEAPSLQIVLQRKTVLRATSIHKLLSFRRWFFAFCENGPHLAAGLCGSYDYYHECKLTAFINDKARNQPLRISVYNTTRVYSLLILFSFKVDSCSRKVRS